jgi:AhpC/TSA family.
MKKWFLVVWLGVIGSGIAFLFWYNEWQYSLPTPVPENYRAVQTGARVHFKDIPDVERNAKPLFLHFFNPDCPCSRFNITHFRSLVKEYGGEVNFVVVAMNKKQTYTEEDIRNQLDLPLPVVFDSAYAAACGVYSTPQAAIITPGRQLFYRGNYNRTRYCTDKKSNYAQMAIDSLLKQTNLPYLGQAATTSYGCALPVCTQ